LNYSLILMKNLIPLLVVIAMLLGIALGNLIKIELPKIFILIAIYVMLVPVMMNINLNELSLIFKENVFALIATIGLNFLIFPIIACLIFLIFKDFYLFIALLLLSFLPTGSMTLNFISLSKGDIHFGAIVQIVSLILGAFLITLVIPFLAKSNLSFFNVLQKVIITIILPLIISQILKIFVKIDKEISKKISLIGMLLIIFLSGYLKSEYMLHIFSKNIFNILGVILFYLISFGISYLISKQNPTIFYCLFLKNISISLGLSVILFPEAVIYLVISYLLQIPIAGFALKWFK